MQNTITHFKQMNALYRFTTVPWDKFLLQIIFALTRNFFLVLFYISPKPFITIFKSGWGVNPN